MVSSSIFGKVFEDTFLASVVKKLEAGIRVMSIIWISFGAIPKKVMGI